MSTVILCMSEEVYIPNGFKKGNVETHKVNKSMPKLIFLLFNIKFKIRQETD